MEYFFVKSDQLLNYTLSLQKINDVALPFAVQNTLNAVSKDVKKRTLKKLTEQQFDIKKRTFFTANSAFKPYKAKQFNYNINRIKSEVGITKGKKANEKATKQVGYQQTATPIKRSVNPLGDKPQTKATIDILSKKPEVYDSEQSYPEGNSVAYIRKADRARRNKTGLLIKNGRRGAVNKVVSMKRRKPTKRDPRKMVIKVKPIASYRESGRVDLKTKKPFLNNAVLKSSDDIMEKTFIKEAEKQIERAIKRR